MAKFAIECPVCGKYAEGKTGFFARKKIQCSCVSSNTSTFISVIIWSGSSR